MVAVGQRRGVEVRAQAARRASAPRTTSNGRSTSVGFALEPQFPSPIEYDGAIPTGVAVPWLGSSPMPEIAKSSRLSPHDVGNVPATNVIVFRPGTRKALGTSTRTVSLT
ncbi:hypothetical protein [Cellulosimicrobium sp. CUA-896]|uniref:hypothetical protein n=1 Tax=Cellulosimicrobium sp. CUA-896 TaxID=1517881 RepID=UPI00095969CE|nr:hypothetical protein [Cellulosimicrobium sp. CUA-896]OLT54322.1 hypothetical protein BJF88_09195 [Cellulosimicrobium sp. CUA-896]